MKNATLNHSIRVCVVFCVCVCIVMFIYEKANGLDGIGLDSR